MAKVLVTGGCGYIGSHTIVDLIENGHEVISADNFSRSDPRILEGVRKITGVNVRNIDIDLARWSLVRELAKEMKGIDGIIHFAAYKSVPESILKPKMYYDNNVLSMMNMLRLSKASKIRHFVFSSSCSVYGNVKKLPVTERKRFEKPESPYAYTKQVCEELIVDFQHEYDRNIKAIALRYFNPVGAHPSALIGEMPIDVPNNLVPYITQTAIGLRKKLTVYGGDYPTRDGSCIRDYIHVMDVAHAHTLALNYMLRGGMRPRNFEIFNLGTGNGVSVLEVIHAFEKANKIKLKYEIGPRRAGDVVAVYASNEKARRKFGWELKYNLEDMMRSAWDWQKALSASTVH